MANTVIKLKKSATPSEAPIDLEYGEIAINYADGRIYYKDSSDTIKHISAGNNYSTVNVGGTFLAAAIENAVLSIGAGDNIELTPNFLNDAFTITANLKVAFDVANAAYNAANAVSGGIDITAIFNQSNVAYITANAAYDKANSANVLAYNTGIGANNYAGAMANAANAYAASLTPDLKPAFDAANQAGIIANSAYTNANATLVLAQAAFDRANLSNDILFIESSYNTANAAYDKANAANVLAYNTGISANAYSDQVGLSSNNYAGAMANAANAYAASLTPDLTPAFEKANDAYLIANAAFDYANGIGTYESASYDVANSAFDTANAAYDKANSANVLAYNTGIGANSYTVISTSASNNWANSVGAAGNSYAESVGISGNVYANLIGTSANSYADSVGLSGNAYSNLVGTSSNNYAGVMANSANAWSNTKIANTDNVWTVGSLNIPNNLYVGGSITNVTQLMFNTSTNITPTIPGALTWSQDDSTLHFNTESPGSTVLHIGQDLVFYVKNQSGQTINKGNVCMFAGTLGASGRLTIQRAIANNAYPSKYIMGVAAADILNGNDGFVISQGKVRGIDTSMFSQGDILYVSATNPGQMQNTMPTAPNNKVTMAAVIYSDSINGSIEVRPTYGSKINEDELAELNALTNGDVLAYVSANGRFENKNTLVSAYGTINSAFGHSNTTYGAVNSAFAVINAAFGSANTVGGYANTAGTIANSAFGAANQAGVIANSGFDIANASYTSVNSAFGVINAAFGSANTVGGYVNTVGGYANTAGTIANGAFGAANQAGVISNSAFGAANQAGVISNSAFGSANTAGTNANGAGTIANSAFGAANQAGTVANNANTYAGSTYVKKAGDTISGDLVVQGNLTISGVSTSLNTSNLYIGDNIITLNADIPSSVAPVENAGIEVNRGNKNSNAALTFIETVGAWAFTSNTLNAYTTYIASNTDVQSANNYAGAMANGAGTIANAAFGAANQAGVISNSAFGAANQAGVISNSAFGHSNATYNAVNSAFAVINAAYSYANTSAQLAYKTIAVSGNNMVAASNVATLTVGNSNGIVVLSNTVNGSIQLTMIPTGVTATTYGGATQIPVLVVDAYGKITSASNTSVQGMDYAYANNIWSVANTSFGAANQAGVIANSAFGAANTKVDTITSNSTTRIWANSVTVGSVETVYLDLANSGVTATTYGGASQVPVITVDSYGRIISASNVAASGGGTFQKITESNTAPVSPSTGDEWLDTSKGILYTYVTDSNSGQWVELGPYNSVAPTLTYNLDGGIPSSIYGGISTIDAGGVA